MSPFSGLVLSSICDDILSIIWSTAGVQTCIILVSICGKVDGNKFINSSQLASRPPDSGKGERVATGARSAAWAPHHHPERGDRLGYIIYWRWFPAATYTIRVTGATQGGARLKSNKKTLNQKFRVESTSGHEAYQSKHREHLLSRQIAHPQKRHGSCLVPSALLTRSRSTVDDNAHHVHGRENKDMKRLQEMTAAPATLPCTWDVRLDCWSRSVDAA
jgi:hypothetical protein